MVLPRLPSFYRAGGSSLNTLLTKAVLSRMGLYRACRTRLPYLGLPRKGLSVSS